MSVDGLLIQSATFNGSAPGANTNILSTSLTPKMGGAFRVTVALATASVFNVIITQSGTSLTLGLNASVALNAGDLYTFVFGVTPSSTYNFQVETNSVIRILQIDEVSGGTT